MRCPACGLDADPAAGLCPHCHSPLPGGTQLPQGTPPPWGANLPAGAQLPQGAPPPWGGPPTGMAPGGRRYPWIGLVAVLAVIFIGAGVTGVLLKVLHKAPKPPGTASISTQPSSANGRTQAMAFDALLNASSRSRTLLGPALDQVEKCGDLNTAIATLQRVTTARDGQLRQGQGLAVDQLEQGTELRIRLVKALTFSLQADQSFVTWAQNVAANGCSGSATHDNDYAAAQAASSGATTTKQDFILLWNPIATQYGLPTRTESTF